MVPVTKACMDFAYNLKFVDIPLVASEQMKKYIFDLVCCSVAGTRAPEVTILQKLFKTSRDSEGVLPYGRDTPASPEIAAIINGAAGHALEMDDSDRTGLSHPGVMVITPALLTAAHCHSTGKALIVACVAGYEVMLRVGTALGLDHYSIWHTTGTTGGLGAAISCGKILKLSEKELTDAFGNAGTLACGLWEFNKTYAMSKLLHVGMGVSHGLMCARLAQKGFTGAESILEGTQGLFAGFRSKDLDLTVFEDFGKLWRAAGVTFKPYPCCRHTHGGIDCGLSLHKLNLPLNQITKIRIETYKAAFDVVASNTCHRTKEGKFSLPYTVVSALVDGEITEKTFSVDSIETPVKQQLLTLCTVEVAEDIQGVHPHHENCRVTIELRNGKSFTEFVFDPLGEPENPMDWYALAAKGRQLLANLSDEEFNELLQLIQKLDELDDCEKLYRLVQAYSCRE